MPPITMSLATVATELRVSPSSELKGTQRYLVKSESAILIGLHFLRHAILVAPD